MRIALNASGEVGTRAGRILLAERDLNALGLYGHSGKTEDRRTMAIRELTGFTVLVVDEPSPTDALALAGIAADDGLSAVLAVAADVEPALAERFLAAGTTLLTGAGLSGIADSLAAHEAARVDDETSIEVAWTVNGSPLRSGEAIPFPDPIGPRWGTVVERLDAPAPTLTRIEVPVDREWSAAMARVSAGTRRARIIGVADLGVHLEAIALAAGALAVTQGSFPPGVWKPADAAEPFLKAALDVGMEVATFTS